MLCPRCSTPNKSKRKFCTQCGKSLGAVCARCSTVNGTEDRFCGECGAALGTAAVSPASPMEPSNDQQSALPRQYTPDEIEALLSLRAMNEAQAADMEKLDQSEIDDLFP